MSKTIALVACVSKKYYSRLPARELYISPWFRKASTYGESIADEWYILSAKYGLLSPTTIIEPYDETLNNMPVNERRSWAEKVLVDLRQKVNPGDKLVILAGVKYRENLIGPLHNMGCDVKIPMEGLGIGKQLQWLSRHNREGGD